MDKGEHCHKQDITDNVVEDEQVVEEIGRAQTSEKSLFCKRHIGYFFPEEPEGRNEQ